MNLNNKISIIMRINIIEPSNSYYFDLDVTSEAIASSEDPFLTIFKEFNITSYLDQPENDRIIVTFDFKKEILSVDSLKNKQIEINFGKQIVRIKKVLISSPLNSHLLNSFSKLLPHLDQESLHALIITCEGQIDKFKTLFQVFQNKPQFALRVAEIVGKIPKDDPDYYHQFSRYLMDARITETAKKKFTPTLMNWISHAKEEDLDTFNCYLRE